MIARRRDVWNHNAVIAVHGVVQLILLSWVSAGWTRKLFVVGKTDRSDEHK